MDKSIDAHIPNSVRDTLLFQYDIACQLLEYNLNGLEETECLWLPRSVGLHVRETDGVWRADWPETETYDIGPPSIAWVTWHIIYWWSMVFEHSFGDGRLTHKDVKWPGSTAAAIESMMELKERWLSLLRRLTKEELLATDKTKWPFSDRPFSDLCAWLNLELMKNATEIGSGRFLYATR